MDPIWLRFALAELRSGVREVAGSGDNPRIVEYHQATTGRFQDDEVPWCSSFVNWCFHMASLQRTGSARARSWLGWGARIGQPPIGAVTILQRGSGPQPGPEVLTAAGHVGFYLGEASDTEFLLLGGNQGDAVTVRPYAIDRVLGYRWPAESGA